MWCAIKVGCAIMAGLSGAGVDTFRFVASLDLTRLDLKQGFSSLIDREQRMIRGRDD